MLCVARSIQAVTEYQEADVIYDEDMSEKMDDSLPSQLTNQRTSVDELAVAVGLTRETDEADLSEHYCYNVIEVSF